MDKFMFENNNLIIKSNDNFDCITIKNNFEQLNVSKQLIVNYNITTYDIEFIIDLIVNKNYSIKSMTINDVVLKIKFNEKNNFDDKYNTKIILPNNLDMDLLFNYQIINVDNKNDIIKLKFFKNM
jgi:hypothetical protein